MSHPAAISCRCTLTISRIRRRMRFRCTAPPSAFLTLQPNRLISRPFGRRNTGNSRADRRRASRYTASYSARRTSRLARGSPKFGGSDARETVAPFLSAARKHFASARTLHSCTESVFLMTCPHMGLIRPFRQRFLPVLRPPTATEGSLPIGARHSTRRQRRFISRRGRIPHPSAAPAPERNR